MKSILDFMPLYPLETEQTVMERLEGWANEGLVEGDPARVDTREGSMWQTLQTPVAREFARAYDLAGTEVPASMSPLSSWGSYLDDLAAAFGLERTQAHKASGLVRFVGPEGTEITPGLRLQAAGVSSTEPVLFEVTAGATIGVSGEVEVPAEAVEAGKGGNVGSGAINAATITLPEGVTLENPEPFAGGADVQSDAKLLAELQEAFLGRQEWGQVWYVQQTRRWLRENHSELCPEGGRVWVNPVWEGPGTVRVTAADDEDEPLPSEVLAALQTFWDPGVSGRGEGHAPVTSVVTVRTVKRKNFNVKVKIKFREGYTLSGFGGTVAMSRALQNAIIDYFHEEVVAGSEVVYAKVEAALGQFAAVIDLVELRVNTGTANVDLSETTAEVPFLVALEATEI